MIADGAQFGSVLVITGEPGRAAVTTALCADVRRLAGAPAERVLSPDDAFEMVLPNADIAAARDIARNVSHRLAAPVDINAVAASGRRKKLLVADMNSTIIQQECIDEMADLFGLKARISTITERAMRGELAFEAALSERLGLLAGLDEGALETVWRERIRLMPGACTAVATMRAYGAYSALVSGGFTFFTSRVARAAGFHTQRANQLEFGEGRLTGRVLGPILGREAKLAALSDFARDRGLPLSATLAVGDGANDLDMIRAAGLGVAYRAKPQVAAEAAASIVHGDLTALLYLQGFSRADFVTPGEGQ